ncbi:MAG: PepSY-associated TM helix domain-containing protein [Stagnimonas sp.]|nr:PepSY-associated TM helix domain-containing protein [Stagnimonas sp.]
MSADAPAARQRRSYWLKTLHQWHWISAALSLIGLIVFAITGITLNHASQIKATPQVVTLKATLPEPLRESLATQPEQGTAPLPPALRAWLADEWSLRSGGREAEWSADEVYLSLPRPGGDGWLSVDRASGELEYEQTDRGWVSYFNDLHKGRNAGPMWGWFIDLFAGACLLFALTGLFLLKLHAVQRPLTWPVVGLGVVIPLLLALLFVH